GAGTRGRRRAGSFAPDRTGRSAAAPPRRAATPREPAQARRRPRRAPGPPTATPRVRPTSPFSSGREPNAPDRPIRPSAAKAGPDRVPCPGAGGPAGARGRGTARDLGGRGTARRGAAARRPDRIVAGEGGSGVDRPREGPARLSGAALSGRSAAGVPLRRTGPRAVLRRHRWFLAVFAVGAALRVAAMLGYRPALWFPDSYTYVVTALRPSPDLVRPAGYSMFLRLLEPFHSFAVVAFVQHLLGLALG